MASTPVQSFFRDLHTFSQKIRAEYNLLTKQVGELQSLPRHAAAEAESSQLTYLQYGIGSVDEQVRRLHEQTTASLSFTDILTSFYELYDLNQKCLMEVKPLVEQQHLHGSPAARRSDVLSPKQPTANDSSGQGENSALNTPLVSGLKTPADAAPLHAADADGAQPPQRTPPPVRYLDFDLLESTQKEKRVVAERHLAQATETLARLRTPKKDARAKRSASTAESAPAVAAPPPATGVTEDDLAELRQSSSYLLMRCSLDDINGFLDSLRSYMSERGLSRLTDSDLSAATAERNRKTLILVLKKLNRLHAHRDSSSLVTYTLQCQQ